MSQRSIKDSRVKICVITNDNDNYFLPREFQQACFQTPQRRYAQETAFKRMMKNIEIRQRVNKGHVRRQPVFVDFLQWTQAQVKQLVNVQIKVFRPIDLRLIRKHQSL